MKIKILLVEDDNVVRQMIHSYLDHEPGMKVVGEASDGAQAIALASELQPDVVLMDVELRDSAFTGQQAARRITNDHKEVKVLALSHFEKISFVDEMLKAGAAGYLSKRCSAEELVEGIETVLEGKRYFDKKISELVKEDYVNGVLNPHKVRKNMLSERESQVLRLTALGDTSQEIADRLGLSFKTVDFHTRKILKKLKLRSKIDLVRYAIRKNIISADE